VSMWSCSSCGDAREGKGREEPGSRYFFSPE
jgi:hypothetical protein